MVRPSEDASEGAFDKACERAAVEDVPGERFRKNDVEMLWPEWPSALTRRLPPLTDKAVQVFAVPFYIPSGCLDRVAVLLDACERERAGRFHFARDRRRYIACRATLRTILGAYTGLSPSEIAFEYSGNGKPRLSLKGCVGLQFNVTHSAELALIALTRGFAVGVDVERVHSISDSAELVARFFSPAENAAFQRLRFELRPEAFFNLWTRKEAWLKAAGEGIGHLLNRVEVRFLPGEPAGLVSLPEGWGPVSRWTLSGLAPAAGYAGALAIEATDVEVQCWAWPSFGSSPDRRGFNRQ